MASAPIVLVPGFWLGAWAWNDVIAALRADDHDVTAITLPGLESSDTRRPAITLSDHIEAICQAVSAKGVPVVLAVHSGAGVPGYAASDRIPDQLAAIVYVDSGPCARRHTWLTRGGWTCRASSSARRCRRIRSRPRSKRGIRGSANWQSCAASATSTCRPVTGQCGRARGNWRPFLATWRGDQLGGLSLGACRGCGPVPRGRPG